MMTDDLAPSHTGMALNPNIYFLPDQLIASELFSITSCLLAKGIPYSQVYLETLE